MTNVSIGGWLELVHHLLTVVGAHSNCSDNHLLVLFLSARTTLILFSISYFAEIILQEPIVCYKNFTSREL